ncbi:MAG: ATP-grasp domain-containing protein [Syntrophobacterales bacterium]|nr:ATP-grasp domain-containing protein [Syntrophobacterales bacterium]
MNKVSLSKHLRFCWSVATLRIRLNWEDYSPQEQALIQGSETIYYPSRLYEQFFKAIGKRVFPKNYCEFIGNKIRQTLLFEWLSIPHPRTGIYYGRDRVSKILKDFDYPFIAKDPIGSSQGRGVFLISSRSDLEGYVAAYNPSYVQEYIPVDRDLRVVIFASQVVHAYWRIGRVGEFRHNVSRGASISFEDIPSEALRFAEYVAKRCGFEDVGLDIIFFRGRFYVIEANMVYGREGFRCCGKRFENVIMLAEKEGRL